MSIKTTITTSLTLLIALLLGACGASNSNEGEKSTAQAPKMPTPPTMMVDPAERAGYMVNGIFEGVEQMDTNMFASDDERESWFSDFYGIGNHANEEAQREAVDTYFKLATPEMDSIAIEIASDYLGHPNSPIFDEGRYILVMEEASKQGLLDRAEQVRLEDRKLLYSRNKIGSPAEDFSYKTADGATHTLYNSFKGKEILLMFYNPDCGTCKHVMEVLNTSSVVKGAVEKGLKVLCIYTEDDKDEWLNKLDMIPTFATVGHNADGTIWRESLYDLRAMPTLYLLDKDKTVILKDVFPEELENYLSK